MVVGNLSNKGVHMYIKIMFGIANRYINMRLLDVNLYINIRFLM
jgi:hypothetical protein